ncbi:hypothetical protein E2C01_030769 [Portunus trituberculatus]|uniref:Uncharacterized protein n=1 Tax=Portunus trituberculatus TaxID=210409 RepID=A0A5B7EV35_PORTR|nr:hypothetical protein [Portunus trituberculatus]
MLARRRRRRRRRVFRLVGGGGAEGRGGVGRGEPSRHQPLPLGCGGDTEKDLKLVVVEVMVVAVGMVVVNVVGGGPVGSRAAGQQDRCSDKAVVYECRSLVGEGASSQWRRGRAGVVGSEGSTSVRRLAEKGVGGAEKRARTGARGTLHEAMSSQTLGSLPGTAKFKTWQGVSDFGRVSLQEVKSITTGEAHDAGLCAVTMVHEAPHVECCGELIEITSQDL